MNALKLLVAAAITVGASLWTQGQPSSPAGDLVSNYSVTVRYGTNLPVSKSVAQELESDVLDMVRNANYNSAMPHKGVSQRPEPATDITQHYRELVAAGKYVLVKWATPQKLETVLGGVSIVEAIVELDRPGVWMCVMDPEGRLIHLGKFRGDALAALEKRVRQLPN